MREEYYGGDTESDLTIVKFDEIHDAKKRTFFDTPLHTDNPPLTPHFTTIIPTPHQKHSILIISTFKTKKEIATKTA